MELSTLPLRGRHPGPHVLITGGVHGDEFEPMAALRLLGRELTRRILLGEVTLVPVVNEDAFQLGQRVGSDGLDLARVCPGRPDGSITERVAHALSVLIRSSDFYVDLHTGGSRLCIHPLCGYMLHRNPDVLDRQRRMARAFGLPVMWGTTPSLDGRSLSVARDANVPSIYVEYLGGVGCQPIGVNALVKGCLNLLADLGVIEDDVTHPEVEPLLIEDHRARSGYLQIQHPAPTGGLFEPVVSLGQQVLKGAVLGTISDILGQRNVPVLSNHSGMVIALHTFSGACEGEGLAVVLETDPPPARHEPAHAVT